MQRRLEQATALDFASRSRLFTGRLDDPHALLGAHPSVSEEGRPGLVIRCHRPGAEWAELWLDGVRLLELRRDGLGGVFVGFLERARLSRRARLRVRARDVTIEQPDPYRFVPTLDPDDLAAFMAGEHPRIDRFLGARPIEWPDDEGGPAIAGVMFGLWAPNALGVGLLGSRGDHERRGLPMRRQPDTGIWQLFVPELPLGAVYEFELITASGERVVRADPLARALVEAHDSLARVEPSRSSFAWTDEAWLAARAGRRPEREPLVIDEVHLGSFLKPGEPDPTSNVDHWPDLAETTDALIDRVCRLGHTHVQLMPVMEHPYGGSWGYQTTGYFAPTVRLGGADRLRALIDRLHAAGVGVLLDWVPAHFAIDEHALARFDGAPLYEHHDPRRAEHPHWGTLVFDYGRPEVRSFLISSALYWLEEFHADGLRIDAVASMLWLDYGRPFDSYRNPDGSPEDRDAASLLRELNRCVAERCPGAIMIAEDSSTWPGVTKPIAEGGLGFQFKWNLGWMNDTLRFMACPPGTRGERLDLLLWGMHYEYDEHYINPLSHDEVVHGKRALLAKLPGTPSERLADLRVLFGYQVTRPGKVLLFMGSELAPDREWSHVAGLPWELAQRPDRVRFQAFMVALLARYRELPCLWRGDFERRGFEWVVTDDRDNAVLAFLRRDPEGQPHEFALVVLAFGRRTHHEYRIGVPWFGKYRVALTSDAAEFGGSGLAMPERIASEARVAHRRRWSISLPLPARSLVILVPEPPG